MIEGPVRLRNGPLRPFDGLRSLQRVGPVGKAEHLDARRWRNEIFVAYNGEDEALRLSGAVRQSFPGGLDSCAMMTRLAISGYRSLRDVRVTLGALTVVTGANGSGKSSLYRALKLLADIAQGRIIQSLAAEGGLQSTLWAGPEAFSRAMKAGKQPVLGVVRKNSISLKLGFSGDDYGYAMDLGLPSSGIFLNDPAIKVESLWTGERLGRSNAFAVRTGPFVRIRNDKGEWREAYQHLEPFDSMMTHCSDPREALELLLLRERMRDWRFYDHLRTDR